jgi:hypothetical protein
MREEKDNRLSIILEISDEEHLNPAVRCNKKTDLIVLPELKEME